MHIVLHTQYYPPEIGAPQNRLHELGIELLKMGIQVTVLTAMPNYPLGKLYDGYSGWLISEELDGIQVIRTAIYPIQSSKFIPRLLSYFSFVFSSLFVGLWKIKKVDFILTESPPLFLGISGFLLSRLLRARWIFNISDLWPESVVELGMIDKGSRSYKLASVCESFFYSNAWLVTCQSKTILENIQARFPEVPLYLLSNGVDTNFFHSKPLASNNRNFHLVYAGLHGLAQGLEQILMAACRFPVEENVSFILVGDGPEKKRLIKMAESMSLETVHFSDPVPKDNMPEVLQRADVIIIPLRTQLTGAVPSKLYEAMSMNKPVILLAESEAAHIVRDSQCGIAISPGDIDGLVSSIRYLKDHPECRDLMGNNGREAAIQNHDRKNIAVKFGKILLEGHPYNE